MGISLKRRFNALKNLVRPQHKRMSQTTLTQKIKAFLRRHKRLATASAASLAFLASLVVALILKKTTVKAYYSKAKTILRNRRQKKAMKDLNKNMLTHAAVNKVMNKRATQTKAAKGRKRKTVAKRR